MFQLKSKVKGQLHSCSHHPRLSSADSDATDATILYPFTCIPSSHSCSYVTNFTELNILILDSKQSFSWLKQIWSCKSENDELTESAAIKLARKLNPFVKKQYAKRIVAVISTANLH